MNTLFDFYWEIWHYVQTSRRDEHWVIEIIEMTEGIEPSWTPSREKLDALDVAYSHTEKNKDDLKVISAFIQAAKTDLSDDKAKKTQNLLAEISAPSHLPTVLQ